MKYRLFSILSARLPRVIQIGLLAFFTLALVISFVFWKRYTSNILSLDSVPGLYYEGLLLLLLLGWNPKGIRLVLLGLLIFLLTNDLIAIFFRSMPGLPPTYLLRRVYNLLHLNRSIACISEMSLLTGLFMIILQPVSKRT